MPSQQILVAMTDDLVITAKRLLDELNVYNDGVGRADHPLQADFFQRLHKIFNKFINSNDGDESDSTYRTKMQQLIDDVLSYKPPLRVYNSTGMATLTLKMSDEDTSTEDMKNADVAAEEANTRDNNDTLTSDILCKIYGKEVFNKTDDLIEDSLSIPNATAGKKMRPRQKKG
jgi:hypothetical protein